MSICTFAMRAFLSSREIGFASTVMDLSSAAEAAGRPIRALIAMSGAQAAPLSKLRLDNKGPGMAFPSKESSARIL
jgi:hypothetical protein